MDLRAEWNKLGGDTPPLDTNTISSALQHKSQLAIATLVRGLRIKSYWVLGFIATFLVFSWLSIGDPAELIINALFLTMAGYLYMRLRAFLREQRQLPTADIPPASWVDIQANSIRSVLEKEATLVDFMYIFMGGFYLILQPVLSEETLLAQLQMPKFWIKGLLVIVVIVLTRQGGRKMSQMAFGQHLEALSDYQEALRAETESTGK